jgi:hypothetical protein
MDHREYAEHRYLQLHEARFRYWVWRSGDGFSCPNSHLALDGIALPPEHPFWLHWRLPIHPDCGCYIVGTHSEAGVRRLGGDVARELPTWWKNLSPTDGMPAID